MTAQPSEKAMAADRAMLEACPHAPMVYPTLTGDVPSFPLSPVCKSQCGTCRALALDAFAEERVGNLLARIHRDGGHYMAEHGYEKALEDAEAVVVGYQQRARETEAAVEEARREEREACALLVENHGHSGGRILPTHRHLASAIRSRSSRSPEVGAGASDFDEHCAPDNCCVCDSRLCTSEECGKPRHDGSVQTTSGAWCCSEKCWGIIAAKAEHSEAGAGGGEEQ